MSAEDLFGWKANVNTIGSVDAADAQNPTRISILTGFCPRQPSHEKESQGQLQPREGGFDGRLEVF
ncbi:hypothetical protein K9U33_10095 [Rhodoblastus acidophilus]|uniref:hypothetical protein n=1 Tax=Candidatus Rhodoblastus alkanivorans TaxID=2954117 RepID=UPI001FAA7F63|nr:hypothetical protein [Candidatus Rhodoblastus alkanivorans]MCI4678999.1 hypothetical protein [Candidatus Rhodoblastus alkanivorans]